MSDHGTHSHIHADVGHTYTHAHPHEHPSDSPHAVVSDEARVYDPEHSHAHTYDFSPEGGATFVGVSDPAPAECCGGGNCHEHPDS